MNYTSLKASIQSWSERSYDGAQLDEFIANAEAQIRRRLVGYQREIATTFAVDANGSIALPADFIAMRSVYLGAVPYRYAISGTTLTIEDGASQSFDVVYLGKLPALGSSTATNWLTDAAPDVYLLLCQAQQRAFEEEYGTAAGLEATGLARLDELGLQNTVAQYGRQGLSLPVRAQ
jgi:hypothetical protein